MASSSSSSSSAIDETFRLEERGSNRIEEESDLEVGVSYSSSGGFFEFGSWLSRSSSVRCRYVSLQAQRQNDEEVNQSWMMKKVKRFEEIIQAMARSKWRSFINGIVNKRRSVRFQYDPRSYALNFDHGIGEDGSGGGRHGYSPPSESPMGLGIRMNRSEI
ncbi:uncharacterized protein LOC111496346 [Cucurbita maxima]|uniref:Uncharacterized protein LOC111496346 n=1 Tax=Cucurbita maxima TaxID=3661 RepID=A0A6J1KJS5_CUCMA|nr:uncharacterized protein LOC111496346 [Cucurbita maxima]